MLYEELNSRKKKLGMTTEQLSQLSGVPVGTINKILSGETKSPRYDTLRALENVLYGLNGESPELNSRMTESDIRALSRMTPDTVREAARPYYTKRQGEYTVEDYRALPEDVRAELIDGVLIFLEAPTFTHQEVLSELLLEFGNYVRNNKGPCRVVPSPLDVQLDCDDRTMVQPDIAVICRNERITRKGVYGAPDLCIEVISESTRKLGTPACGNTGSWIRNGKRSYAIYLRENTRRRSPCTHSMTGCRSGSGKDGWKWTSRRYRSASGPSLRKNDAEGPARGRQILYAFQV